MDKYAPCAACLTHPPAYDAARAALVYDDASRPLILKFKHGDRTHAVRSFTPWLARAGADLLDGADLIVPVPLHRWRLIARRYNQAALLGTALSAASGVPHDPRLLIRRRATKSQGHMTAAARAANVRGAFAVAKGQAAALKDKTVILIDDVYTTGATVEACAKTLKRAGAREVRVLALARVAGRS